MSIRKIRLGRFSVAVRRLTLTRVCLSLDERFDIMRHRANLPLFSSTTFSNFTSLQIWLPFLISIVLENFYSCFSLLFFFLYQHECFKNSLKFINFRLYKFFLNLKKENTSIVFYLFMLDNTYVNEIRYIFFLDFLHYIFVSFFFLLPL